MVVTHLGKMFITNDAATIIKELEVCGNLNVLPVLGGHFFKLFFPYRMDIPASS
jgi:hypothetical protein